MRTHLITCFTLNFPTLISANVYRQNDVIQSLKQSQFVYR